MGKKQFPGLFSHPEGTLKLPATSELQKERTRRSPTCAFLQIIRLINVFNYTTKELRRARMFRIKIVPELAHGCV